MGLARWKDKLSKTVSKNSDKIDEGIEKTAGYADEKTGGKYSDRIDSAADQARDYKDKLKDDDEGSQP